MKHQRPKWLIIRADASTEMGSGHLMRALALGQAWQGAGGWVIFITACRNEGLLQRLSEERFIVHPLTEPHPDGSDWAATRNVLAEHPNAWVALDGYYFDEVYQKHVKDAGHRLLVTDDIAQLKHYYPDILLNQNLGSEELSYSCEPYTRLLLGTRYVLLRREFLAWKKRERVIPEVARHVLVTMGGSDPDNATFGIIQALREVDIPGLEALVVVGAGNPHAESLEAAARQSPVPIRFVYDAKNMPELMARADVAVSAEAMHARKISVNLGWYHSLRRDMLVQRIKEVITDGRMRRKMSGLGRPFIDGKGAQRVIEAILEKSGEPAVYGRK
jgi:UDP-2,4-diacetamido-2,4,6-trideoxy-beta-L-altropyranose hydrolase